MDPTAAARTGYRPISDYALIGNRNSCALVSLDGSIDWCCLPHVDSPSVFAALLDANRGGAWKVAPATSFSSTRRYLGPSAVLETRFETEGGVLIVTDFLPIRRGDRARSESAHTIVRSLRCESGAVEVEIEWRPRPNYARDDVELSRDGVMVYARSPGYQLALGGFPETERLTIEDGAARAIPRLGQGDELSLVCAWSGADPDPVSWSAAELLEDTVAWWDGWASRQSPVTGADRENDLALRSGMVLKLLTHEPTGAIAAAATTSLPEEIGGIRNWDYRFCWVRDASMVARALLTLGHGESAREFLSFLETAAERHNDPSRIQVLYPLRAETRITEYTLGHLDGYRDSRPVRIGNAAAWQNQLDVYGELLQAAWELHRYGERFTAERQAWLRGVADHVCTVWQKPDRGIWEVRGPEQHFTYSKVMCWVALDRAVLLGRALGWSGTERWAAEAEAIRERVLTHGFDDEQNAFVQSFDSRVLDASSLLIPIVGFLPADDPRVQGTIDATLRTLTEDGLVFRYIVRETPDGVGGGEGAFGICTFWLAHALALSGRVDEAREIFYRMARRANDVGLYAEEIDPRTGEFLGNFPQAFTHVGLINAAGALTRASAAAGDAGSRRGAASGTVA